VRAAGDFAGASGACAFGEEPVRGNRDIEVLIADRGDLYGGSGECEVTSAARLREREVDVGARLRAAGVC
jgi:hypothetical protein